MSHSKTAAVVLLFLSLAPLVGCGYLDEELLVSDEQFQEGLHAEGIGTSGMGYSRSFACGGGIVRLSRLRIRGRAALRARTPHLQLRSPSEMTDEEILNQTEIGVIDETPSAEPTTTNDVASAYYAVKAQRDTAISNHYASAQSTDPVQAGGEEEVGHRQ